jgi:hypothetical protein
LIFRNYFKENKVIGGNLVKSRFFLAVILTQLLSAGCKKLDIERELRIDIGSFYQNDFVSIQLDDNVVFSDSVSTNAILGVAEILVFEYPIGKYEITVNVNGTIKKEKFRHNEDRFVYISFDKPSSEITISYPSEKYVYE